MADMSLSNVTQGRIIRPLRISLYGIDGVGKSTFGADAPNPIFIATEDGTNHLDVARFPVPEQWSDIVGPEGALARLYLEEHDYQTVVIDSLDWAESLCDQYLVERHNAQHNNSPIEVVSDIPYGGWKQQKVAAFGSLLDALSALVREKNMHAILISHAEIVRFADPERDTYERYSLKLFKDLAARVREWSDYNLFANYDMTVSKVGQGFNKRNVGVSHGKRLIYSQRRAAYDAKARFAIPERLPLSWDEFWAAHEAALQS